MQLVGSKVNPPPKTKQTETPDHRVGPRSPTCSLTQPEAQVSDSCSLTAVPPPPASSALRAGSLSASGLVQACPTEQQALPTPNLPAATASLLPSQADLERSVSPAFLSALSLQAPAPGVLPTCH